MTQDERKHLAKLLGMLGSDQVGERASAALIAEKFRTEHNVTWGEILQVQPLETSKPTSAGFRVNGVHIDSQTLEILGKALIERYWKECPTGTPRITEWWAKFNPVPRPPPPPAPSPAITKHAEYVNQLAGGFIGAAITAPTVLLLIFVPRTFGAIFFAVFAVLGVGILYPKLPSILRGLAKALYWLFIISFVIWAITHYY